MVFSRSQTKTRKEPIMQLFSRPRWRRTDAPRPSARFRPRLEALEGRDVPSTLTVTSAADSGPGSLRAEIAAAKNNTTIVFDGKLDGSTITLTSGELNITTNITIKGPSAELLTVSGGGASRVFEVAPKVKVNLGGMTISDGRPGSDPNHLGGGVFNHGTLAVTGCIFSGNAADYGGGLANDFGGTLTLSGCTVSDNTAFEGGGVWNGGTLAVSSSLIGLKTDSVTGTFVPGNDSYEGGGIYNVGKATISGGTSVSGNTATGGDQGSGFGGGIYNDVSANLTVSNCTLSGNSAGNSGGGIYNAGKLTVSGSAFSGNTAAGGDSNIFGPYTDGGGNTFG
jgi:hypothetical protein